MATTRTTARLTLATAAADPHVRALAQFARDVITGATGTTLTLGAAAGLGIEWVFKNGALLTPGTDYTVANDTITLGAAALSADTFIVFRWTRA